MRDTSFHTGHPDPRLLQLPGAPPDYDIGKNTLFHAPLQLTDFDVGAFSSYDVRAVFVSAMLAVERSGDEVDGFVQQGDQILVAGRGGNGHTGIVHVCPKCRWPRKAHRDSCELQAVEEVHDL